MYPLEYLGLAPARGLEGKRAEIRAVYEHFFDLWKVTGGCAEVCVNVLR